MWSARASTAQDGVERADPVLREVRLYSFFVTARAVLLRLRECCVGSGHPVGQLAVEGRRCCLRRQPRDLLPLGAGGIDPDRSGRAGVVQAGDETLQRGDVELVGAGPARHQLDVQPPWRGLRRGPGGGGGLGGWAPPRPPTGPPPTPRGGVWPAPGAGGARSR